MSLREKFPDPELTGSQILDGDCPMCEGRRELPSSDSPSGYEDCTCKALAEFRCVCGPDLRGIKHSLTSSPLSKYFGKTVFIRNPAWGIDDERAKSIFLSHVKFILGKEFTNYLLARKKREFYPYPEWVWMQSSSVVDLIFQAGKSDQEAADTLQDLRVYTPWLIMEIGKTTYENPACAKMIPTFCRFRSDKGLSTWVFTRRADSELMTVYGKEMLNWIKVQAKPCFKQ